jgi:hypothetical protein
VLSRLNSITKRNTEKGKTFEFVVSKEYFSFVENWFEKPNEKEQMGEKILC